MRVLASLGLALVVAALVVGCVGREHERVRQAREDHRACVEEHGEDAPECQALLDVVREEYDRYEEKAQRHWGDRERDRTWSP